MSISQFLWACNHVYLMNQHRENNLKWLNAGERDTKIKSGKKNLCAREGHTPHSEKNGLIFNFSTR